MCIKLRAILKKKAKVQVPHCFYQVKLTVSSAHHRVGTDRLEMLHLKPTKAQHEVFEQLRAILLLQGTVMTPT